MGKSNLPPELLKNGGPGRPKGIPNKATLEIKELARAWTTGDPEWCESARQRMKDGKAPHLENYLLGMGHGLPKKEGEDGAGTAIAVTVLGILQQMPPQLGVEFARRFIGSGEPVEAEVVEPEDA
jgi:hypothetical protein